MKSKLLFAWLCLVSATSAHGEDVPGPGTVGIKSVQFSGVSCPKQGARVDISQDRQAMTVLFSDFRAEVPANWTGRPPAGRRVACAVIVTFSVPNGFKAAFDSVEARGFLNLEGSGTYSTHDVKYAVSNVRFGNGVSARTQRIAYDRFTGPYSNDFEQLTQVPQVVMDRVPCSVRGELTTMIVLDYNVFSNQRGKGALITVDTLDGVLREELGIRWERCR